MTCIQCRRSADHGKTLQTRPRPLLRRSEYRLCLECAVRVRKEQDRRAQEAIEEAERAGA
jgi:hypothetical protein